MKTETIYLPRKTKRKTFNESTDVWYGRLADHARDNKYIGLQFLLSNAKLKPYKRNLQSVRNMAETIKDARLRRAVLRTISDVSNGEFKSEFRYKYDSPARSAGQCSACGELFSTIRQALEYHESA